MAFTRLDMSIASMKAHLASPLSAMGTSPTARAACIALADFLFVVSLFLASWELQRDNWTPWEEVTASNPRIQSIPATKWLGFLSFAR